MATPAIMAAVGKEGEVTGWGLAGAPRLRHDTHARTITHVLSGATLSGAGPTVSSSADAAGTSADCRRLRGSTSAPRTDDPVVDCAVPP